MKERICGNCIFWGLDRETMGRVERKVILRENREIRVCLCGWHPHPTLRNYEVVYTERDYNCNEFKMMD